MIAQEDIDPAAYYRVKLNQTVRHGPVWLRPCDNVKLLGSTAIQYYDKLADITLIVPGEAGA